MFKTLLIAFAFMLATTSWAASEAITIGLLPGGDPKATEKQSYVLAEKVQNRLGRPVQI